MPARAAVIAPPRTVARTRSRIARRIALRTALRITVAIALGAIGSPAAAQQDHREHQGAANGGASTLVSGRVLCADGMAPGSAVVQLVHGSGPGRHVMATAIVDSTGRFATRIAAGTYALELLSPGAVTQRREVIVATAPLPLGTLTLGCTPRVTDTLRVRADRDAMELRSGAAIVDVRASSAAGGSIVELLRTVPGIELDAHGRISMRGSPSVLVLVNGRRVALTGDALVAFLRQMPATAVERVEAGTPSSARLDANGTAGVLNLVLRDDAARRTAMRSLAGSMATEAQYMGAAAATGMLGRTLDWDVTYSASAMQPRTGSRTARWSVVPGDLPLQTWEESRAHAEHRLHSVLGGVALSPTPNSSVALRGSFASMRGTYRNRSAFLYANAAGDSGTSATTSLLAHVIPSSDLSAVARLERGRLRMSMEARSALTREDVEGAYVDADGGYRYLTTAMASRQREQVLRSDLGVRFARVAIDVGQESQFRTLEAAHDADHLGAVDARQYRHDMSVQAGYITAQGTAGGVRTELGLRVEGDHSARTRADRTRADRTLRERMSRRTLRAFPSISGSFTDTRRALVYRVAYARRIQRPSFDMLNPFSMGEDDINEIIGNPSLMSEIADQAELGVERHGTKVTVLLTPFLRWSRDPIRPLKAVTTNGGATTSLTNLVAARAIGSDGSVRFRPATGMSVTLAGSAARLETRGAAFDRDGVYASGRLIVDVPVGASGSAQLYAYRRSAQIIEQGEILPAFTTELALTRRLAGDRGRVTLRVNDPLRTDRIAFEVAEEAFSQRSSRRTTRPLFSLFASFAVGGAPREDVPSRTEGRARIF